MNSMNVKTLAILVIVLILIVAVGKLAPEQTSVAGMQGAVALSITHALVGTTPVVLAKKEDDVVPAAPVAPAPPTSTVEFK